MGTLYRRCVDCDQHFHPDEMLPTRVALPRVHINRSEVTSNSRRLIRNHGTENGFAVGGRKVYRWLCLRCGETRQNDAAIQAVEVTKQILSSEVAA